MLKLKLKNNLKSIKDGIIRLNTHLPQTKEMKKHISIKKVKVYGRGYENRKQSERASSIENELRDIRNKLSQLS